jgi:preprotein translocase subunit SecE
MNKLFNYLSQSRSELAKVVWPSRSQAIRLTIAVVFFSAVLAVFIGAMDYVFAIALQKLI